MNARKIIAKNNMQPKLDGNPTIPCVEGSTKNHRSIFSNIRLDNWHSNEEVYNILQCFNKLITQDGDSSTSNWLSDEVIQRPNNGSVFLYDKLVVKNFKKDSFIWKRRKTGGANSVREDRMCLKVIFFKKKSQ